MNAMVPANQMGFGELDDAVVLLFVLGVLGFLLSVGFLIAALVLGRRRASPAPWKRSFGLAGILAVSPFAAVNFVSLMLSLYLGLALASASEQLLVLLLILLFVGGPLGVSVGALVACERLRRRNPPAPVLAAEG